MNKKIQSFFSKFKWWDSEFDASDNQKNIDSINGFNFDDTGDEDFVEEEIDLSVEMIGSEIQRAGATLLIDSYREGASCIYIEPHEKEIEIRLMRDGVLQNHVTMPKINGIQLTACLKNMAQMDIAEKEASQDGKIKRTYKGKHLDIRCSTAPGKYGEKMVLNLKP